MGKRSPDRWKKDPPHSRLYHHVQFSPAYRVLSCTAKSLLMDMIALSLGRNNGDFFLSVRDAQRLLCKGSDACITKAFRQLEKYGFIAAIQRGSFSRKIPTATVWRLTFLPFEGQPPTREFERWRPEPGSMEEKRLLRLFDCNLRSLNQGLNYRLSRIEAAMRLQNQQRLAPLSGTADLQSQGRLAKSTVPEIEAQYSNHRKGAKRPTPDQCKLVRERASRWLAASRRRTQRELARKAQVNESTLSRFLSSPGRTLSWPDLGRLSAAIPVVSKMQIASRI